MSLGDILGQMMQQGLGGQGTQNPRLQNATQNLGGSSGGGGLDAIFGQLQGALGRAGIDTAGLQQSAGGFADKASDFMRKDQVGGLSGAQIGGIGAVAGALLGGGLGGAARGGAMAVLGTLALSALKNAQARRAGQAAPAPVEPHELEAVTAPENEKLLLTAMISAAKADGTIDQTEMQKIIGRISKDFGDARGKAVRAGSDGGAARHLRTRGPGHQPGPGRAGLCRLAPGHRQRLRCGTRLSERARQGAEPRRRHGRAAP